MVKNEECRRILLTGADPAGLKELEDLISGMGLVVSVLELHEGVEGLDDVLTGTEFDIVVTDLRSEPGRVFPSVRCLDPRSVRIPFVAVCRGSDVLAHLGGLYGLFADIVLEEHLSDGSLEHALRRMCEHKPVGEDDRSATERYPFFLDKLPAGVCIMDGQGRVTDWNSAAVAITGYETGSVIGKSCAELGSAALFEILSDGGISCRTIEFVRDDGVKVLLAVKNGLLEKGSSDPTGSVAVFIEMTGRGAGQQDLVRLAHLADSSGVAMIGVSADGVIDAWNKAAVDLYGYLPEEIKGRELSSLWAEGSWPGPGGLLGSDGSVRHVQEVEVLHSRKDGSEVVVSMTISPLRDELGEVSGFSVLSRDLTRWKESESNLLKLTRAVEQSGSVILITDIDGNIEYVNPKFTDVTGYGPEEAIGKNPRFLQGEAFPPEEYKSLWNSISHGLEWRGEFCNRKKNGDLYWELASISPIRSEKGEVLSYMKVAEDISEKKEYEKKMLRLATFPELNPMPIIETDIDGTVTYLNPVSRIKFPELMHKRSSVLTNGLPDVYSELKNEAKKYTVRTVSYSGRTYRQDISYVRVAEKLRVYMTDITEREMADRMKDELISTVSHELRTPLSITKEGISIMLEGILGEINEKQGKILGTALENIKRLERIINELLDISKIESGKIVISREMTDMVVLVNNVLESFRSAMKDKRDVELESEFSDARIMLYVDPDKLTQVFTNLVANSLRFTDRGHIRVVLEKKPMHLECRVIDTGKGIRKQDVPKVFDKFQQFSRTPGEGGKGTGLGLAISKGIVDLHGGRISIESELDKGTEITFTIPIYSAYELALECVDNLIASSQRDRQHMSIIYLKASAGSDAGQVEEALREEIANMIRGLLRRSEDFVVREDDWFIVGLSGCNDIEVIRVAGRIYNRVNLGLADRGLAQKVLLKSGQATYPYDGSEAGTLIDKAQNDVQ